MWAFNSAGNLRNLEGNAWTSVTIDGTVGSSNWTVTVVGFNQGTNGFATLDTLASGLTQAAAQAALVKIAEAVGTIDIR